MSRDPESLWETIEGHITGQRHQELVATLATLDDAERTALVKPLRPLARTPADELPNWDIFGSLAVAGAAILPEARSLAAWLRRHEARDRVRTFDGLADCRIGVVQVWLMTVEPVPEILAANRFPAPVRLLGVLEDDRYAREAVVVVRPVVEVTEWPIRVGSRTLEPRVGVGRVVQDEVDDDLDPGTVCSIEERDEVVY